jgi:hypothetical protein
MFLTSSNLTELILKHLKSNCNIFFLLLNLICVGGGILHQERGNFLLQAMLALGLIFAFIPFLSYQIAEQNIDTKMYAATRQAEIAQTAARIFIRENVNNIPYDTTIISGNHFADTLEPYGLPLGFVPRTALGHDIALVIHKTPDVISAYLELRGDKLSELENAELARRIGFYAAPVSDGVDVGIDLQDVFSDIVRRNETDLDNSAFLTDLDMNNFSIKNTGNLFATNGDFVGAQFRTLTITGVENGRKEKNDIKYMQSDKTVFQSKTGEAALTLSKGTLYANSVNARSISLYGNTGNFTTINASVYELSMTAGRASFVGPSKWDVRGSVVASNINFSAERLDISSHLLTMRGQDVYIDEETLEYNSKSGIETNVISASNITMRDQISSALDSGQTGAAILDIRPAGTSLLPDVLVSKIDNDAFAIIDNPSADDDKTTDCKSIINKLEGVYNKQSLAQYLVCQYVYWQRLEKRINIKQCLMAGGSDCI